MNDLEAWKAVILKASENGFDKYKVSYSQYKIDLPSLYKLKRITYDEYIGIMCKYEILQSDIFSKEFLKAYFGTQLVDSYGNTREETRQKIKEGMKYPIDYRWCGMDYQWGYRGRELLISDDRLQYLKQYL